MDVYVKSSCWLWLLLQQSINRIIFMFSNIRNCLFVLIDNWYFINKLSVIYWRTFNIIMYWTYFHSELLCVIDGKIISSISSLFSLWSWSMFILSHLIEISAPCYFLWKLNRKVLHKVDITHEARKGWFMLNTMILLFVARYIYSAFYQNLAISKSCNLIS